MSGSLRVIAGGAQFIASGFRRVRTWFELSVFTIANARPRQVAGSPPQHELHVAAMGAHSKRGGGAPTINVYGYFDRQFGLAEAARNYALALDQVGCEVRRINLPLNVPHARRHARLPFPKRASAGVDLVVANPDVFSAVGRIVDRSRLANPRVACWFWELDQVPASWRASVEGVDHLIAASSFMMNAFAAFGSVPVSLVPLPVGACPDARWSREHFALSVRDYLFLCVFDFHSGLERKNPHAAIAAFRAAFPRGDEGVTLLIKTSNGDFHRDSFARLREAAAVDSRILIRDQLLDPQEMTSLQRCADALVSLHRSEGFGLSLAELMSQGKPVIATNYSGNTDFMTAYNSCLVGYKLVPVEEDSYPDAIGAWADPDVGEAAAWMRTLAANPDLGRALGRTAQRDIALQLSPAAVGERLLAALSNARSRSSTSRFESSLQRP